MDREQQVERVAAIVLPELQPGIYRKCDAEDIAERIVDALAVPQPDPELERLRAERDRYRDELEEVARDGLPVLRETIAERDRYRKALEAIRDAEPQGIARPTWEWNIARAVLPGPPAGLAVSVLRGEELLAAAARLEQVQAEHDRYRKTLEWIASCESGVWGVKARDALYPKG
jgi:hypothetical protein